MKGIQYFNSISKVRDRRRNSARSREEEAAGDRRQDCTAALTGSCPLVRPSAGRDRGPRKAGLGLRAGTRHSGHRRAPIPPELVVYSLRN